MFLDVFVEGNIMFHKIEDPYIQRGSFQSTKTEGIIQQNETTAGPLGSVVIYNPTPRRSYHGYYHGYYPGYILLFTAVMTPAAPPSMATIFQCLTLTLA